jgi:hypothetical protein
MSHPAGKASSSFGMFLLILAVVTAGFLWMSSQAQNGPTLTLESPLNCKADDTNCPSLMKPVLGRSMVRGIEPPYRFVAFGDWGAGTPFQKEIASQLALQRQKSPFSAVLLLGDNFYPDGNVKKYGKPYFTDMYAPLIKSNVQFIVALGNHDRRGGFQDEQVKFFHMPGYYYTVKKPDVQFFVLDTNFFAKDQVQQQWLEKALRDAKTPWKVVLGHHPIYSSGEHGLNTELQKTLEPLLVKYIVDLYLAGHDHDYERFQPVQGVQHIVEGGGGAYLRGLDKPLPGSLVRLKTHSFLDFSLTPDNLHMDVIDSQGHIIDQAEWHKSVPVQEKPANKAG